MLFNRAAKRVQSVKKPKDAAAEEQPKKGIISISTRVCFLYISADNWFTLYMCFLELRLTTWYLLSFYNKGFTDENSKWLKPSTRKRKIGEPESDDDSDEHWEEEEDEEEEQPKKGAKDLGKKSAKLGIKEVEEEENDDDDDEEDDDELVDDYGALDDASDEDEVCYIFVLLFASHHFLCVSLYLRLEIWLHLIFNCLNVTGGQNG